MEGFKASPAKMASFRGVGLAGRRGHLPLIFVALAHLPLIFLLVLKQNFSVTDKKSLSMILYKTCKLVK